MSQVPHKHGRRELLLRMVRLLAIALGGAAIASLVATLVREWPDVSAALADSNPGGILVAGLVAFAAMWGLGMLWFGTLHAFGAAPRVLDVSAWY